MKRSLALLLSLLLFVGLCALPAYADEDSAAAKAGDDVILADDPDDAASPDDADPETLLRGMTTEEKIAQMLMPAFQTFADETGAQQQIGRAHV